MLTKHQATGRFASSQGDIAWGVAGAGPDVVLVHGTPVSSRVWSDVIERLHGRYRCHFLDLPGYGRSAKFEGQEVRLRSFARVLAEFVRDRGLERPHLVGHDFGAAAVMGAHLVEGLPVASITIADGVLLNPWGTPFSRLVHEHDAVFAAIPEYAHRALLAAHLATAATRPFAPEVEAVLIEPWLGGQGQPAYYRQLAQYDFEYTARLETLYPSLDVPVAMLWGEQDRWLAPEVGRRVHAALGEPPIRWLPDAGHFGMLDSPGLFARELGALLAGHVATLRADAA